jgi:hypothetical protein
MSESVQSSFAKMGEHPLVGTIVNTSGNRSPYTHPVADPAQGDAIATGGTAIRGVGRDATGEHSGPVCSPQTTISYPNSPEAAQTGRGLRTVPSVASRTGNGDFWDRRAFTGQVIA